ncbi:YbaK/EbsC family protein [Blastopirellula sp. JC732]|uniref:YbaK/EbsC family protein n=1 Tax=Blastopirellula sediminis TaxID=2894196 RepID=A0A9X1MJV5_9BACT|nr:YbaK/EbsC family protein [Blastopirellula sediminis]MCC9608735.1 YbaK/EbsC family protein [Blastopirellula sediminis]MCC9628488.1 YbaK/EbsC family protein [Blastopirellula sediminis]
MPDTFLAGHRRMLWALDLQQNIEDLSHRSIEGEITMNVTEYLHEKQVNFEKILHPNAYGANRLAQTLGVSGHQVAKTVLLNADGDYTSVVAVLPADKSVDLRAAAQMLGDCKLTLATEEQISQHCPDCEVGALPPFGSQYHMHTIMDASLLEYENIVFEGNTHHEAIQMTASDFRMIESPLVGHFAR